MHLFLGINPEVAYAVRRHLSFFVQTHTKTCALFDDSDSDMTEEEYDSLLWEWLSYGMNEVEKKVLEDNLKPPINHRWYRQMYRHLKMALMRRVVTVEEPPFETGSNRHLEQEAVLFNKGYNVANPTKKVPLMEEILEKALLASPQEGLKMIRDFNVQKVLYVPSQDETQAVDNWINLFLKKTGDK